MSEIREESFLNLKEVGLKTGAVQALGGLWVARSLLDDLKAEGIP